MAWNDCFKYRQVEHPEVTDDKRRTGLKNHRQWLRNPAMDKLTTWDVLKNPVNNGIRYQPQLVSRISAINSKVSGWKLETNN